MMSSIFAGLPAVVIFCQINHRLFSCVDVAVRTLLFCLFVTTVLVCLFFLVGPVSVLLSARSLLKTLVDAQLTSVGVYYESDG